MNTTITKTVTIELEDLTVDAVVELSLDRDDNYGCDADGNRGRSVTFIEDINVVDYQAFDQAGTKVELDEYQRKQLDYEIDDYVSRSTSVDIF